MSCTRLKAWPKSVRPEDQDAPPTPKPAKKGKGGRKAQAADIEATNDADTSGE